MDRVKQGDVLVTDMTDPNWEPVMKLAAAIVTNRGGRTCHAAIIARELGIPAVVGCGDATRKLKDGQAVTVSCAEGDTGNVYDGLLPFEVSSRERGEMPHIPVKIAMNVGNPRARLRVRAAAQRRRRPGAAGVHHQQRDRRAPEGLPRVRRAARGPEDEGGRKDRAATPTPRTFFREKMVEGVATIAAAFWPKPVIVRLSDFKSNEYRKLLGGERYEPDEENPMLGFRGASRYIARELPRMLRARVRGDAQGARRARPHQRRAHGAVRAHARRSASRSSTLLKKNGLERGKNGLQDRDDVRAAVQRDPRRGVPRALRRLLHRLERPDAAHARPGPRLGPGGRGLRRARPGGEGDARAWRSAPAASTASTSASAARARPTTRTSRAG